MVSPLVSYIYYGGSYLATFCRDMLKYDLGRLSGGSMQSDKVGITIVAILSLMASIVFQEVHRLGKVNLVGLLCIVGLVPVVLADILFKGVPKKDLVLFPAYSRDLLKGVMNAFVVFVMAFMNHFTVIPVVENLGNNSFSARTKIIGLSSAVGLVFYCTVAFAFAYKYPGNTEENILMYGKLAMPDVYKMMSAALTLVNILSYPLIVVSVKESLERIISMVVPVSFMVRYLETVGIVTCSFLIAFFIEGFLATVGPAVLICGSMIMYLFPALFFSITMQEYKLRVSMVERVMLFMNFAVAVLLSGVGVYKLGAQLTLF